MTSTIITQRLILREFTQTDLDDFYEYAKNPDVGPHAGWNPHTSPIESQKILDVFINEDNMWAIVWKENNKVIGSVGVDGDHRRKSERAFQLGYSLSADYWGRGIMTEAVIAVKQFCFTDMQAEIFSVYHFPENDRSRRVIEKCGFKYEGILRRSYTMQNGIVRDECCYSLTREEAGY